jgi:hypothetical protein
MKFGAFKLQNPKKKEQRSTKKEVEQQIRYPSALTA